MLTGAHLSRNFSSHFYILMKVSVHFFIICLHAVTQYLCFNIWNYILWLLIFVFLSFLFSSLSLTVYLSLQLVSVPVFSLFFISLCATSSAFVFLLFQSLSCFHFKSWCHSSCFILIVLALCQCILIFFLCLVTSDLSQLSSHLFPILLLSCLCI